MLTTFQEWMTEGQVSCRGIMALSPDGAERNLQVSAFSATLKSDAAMQASAARGTGVYWLCLVDQGQRGYMCLRDDDTGAWVNSEEKMRQNGIDPTGLPVLTIDRTRHVVPDAVAAFRARLASALENDKGEGGGTEASGGFTPDEKGKLTALWQCLGMVLGACEAGYTDKMTVDGLKTVLPLFLPEAGAPASLAQRLDALEQLRQNVLRMRAFFTADVFLTMRLDLFSALLTALADQMKAANMEEWQIVMQLTRFFLTPYSAGVSNPSHLIPTLVEKMFYEGSGSLVEALAKSRLGVGVSAIESALNAANLDDYGALLYDATHECFAASHLYELLDFNAKQHPDKPGGAWWAQSSKVAEEKLVRCTNALSRLSHGSFQSDLSKHRGRVSEAYQSGGKEARDAVINDLIENNYFYPRSFEKMLAEAA